MQEFRRDGNDEGYAQEASRYNYLIEKLNEQNKNNTKNEKEPIAQIPQETSAHIKGEIGPLGPVPQIPQETSAHVPEESKSTQLVPLYWEVYNKVATEHCSSPARFLYNLSKTTIAPWNQDMSTPEKFLSVIGTPFRAIGKGIGIVGNKITGADKKFEKMKQAVENLTPEEFSVLTDTKEEAKMRGVANKSEFDFELTSDTMRQYKHNTLALDAIFSRVENETTVTQELSNKYLQNLTQAAEKLNRTLKIPNITPIEAQLISEELRKINNEIEKTNNVIKGQVEKRDRIANGIQHRTAKFKDTEGWILGKFNPDNREANMAMQKYQRQYEEAVKSGDGKKIEQVRTEMREFAEGQTKTIQVGDNVHNKISRGNFAVGQIKVQNLTPQTIGQQIIANVAALAVVENIVSNMKNQALKMHEFHYSNSKTTTVAQEIGVNPDLAQEGAKEVTNIAAHGVGEYGNLDQSALENNNSWSSGINTEAYKARDVALHSETAKQVATGDLRSAAEYYKGNVEQYAPYMEKYSQLKGFDYSILDSMDPKSLNEMVKAIEGLGKEITISVDGVVTGAQLAESAGVSLNSMNPATIATILTSQVGHLASTPSNKKKKEKDQEQTQEQQEEKDKKSNDSKDQEDITLMEVSPEEFFR